MTKNEIRAGCKDVWNAYMVEGAEWAPSDIPICPTTATQPPKALISFNEAKRLINASKARGEDDYQIDAFIHFYLDDQKFAGPRNSIWSNPSPALEIARHCAGLITPDFSTYADFPDPLKRDATYKMRAFGYYAGKQGIPVINNVRWGSMETWEYCFDGIPENTVVAIGTVASGIRARENRPLFETGLIRMAETLHPKTILVYGSDSNQCFGLLKSQGVSVIRFHSQTELAYKRGRDHE